MSFRSLALRALVRAAPARYAKAGGGGPSSHRGAQTHSQENISPTELFEIRQLLRNERRAVAPSVGERARRREERGRSRGITTTAAKNKRRFRAHITPRTVVEVVQGRASSRGVRSFVCTLAVPAPPTHHHQYLRRGEGSDARGGCVVGHRDGARELDHSMQRTHCPADIIAARPSSQPREAAGPRPRSLRPRALLAPKRPPRL